MKKYYGIAIRRKVEKEDVFWKTSDFSFSEIVFPCSARYWFADPFLFEYKGKEYVFYEAFDMIKERGYIGYSVINAGKASKPHIIIKNTCHLSFPFIYSQGGNIYIMPESCGKNKVMTYKAIKFPDKWIEDSVVIENLYGTDTIRWNNDTTGTEYAISSEQFRYLPEDKLVSCWVQNKLYEINNVADKEGIVVGKGDYGIRNAGGLFKYDNLIIRPGQDCTKKEYGRGLVFWKVESFLPYRETEIYHIDFSEMQSHIRFAKQRKDLVGCHTYNSTNELEVIDFSYYSHASFIVHLGILMYKVLWKLRRGLRWLCDLIKA